MTLTNPVAATYTVTIDYFDGAPATLPVKLVSYAVPNSAVGNLTVSPASQAVTGAQPVSFQLVTSGLAAGTATSAGWTSPTGPPRSRALS